MKIDNFAQCREEIPQKKPLGVGFYAINKAHLW